MANNSFFSKRTDWDLTTNKFMEVLADLKERNVTVLDLTESNPTQCGFNYIGEHIINPLSSAENLIYAPHPLGLETAREAVREYYRQKNVEIDISRLMLTASTSEAYSFLFRLLLNPGDEVLVPIPSYPLFPYLVGLNDGHVEHYPLYWEQGAWRLDIAALEEAVTKHTKAIVLVNPNNPTGSYLKEDEVLAINRLAEENKLALICDEVFLDFDWAKKTPPITLVSNEDVLTFVLGGVSKSLGLPQMKLAWIALTGPQELVDPARERLEFIADTFLSVNAPAQNALNDWMGQRKEIQKEIIDRLTTNRLWLEERLRSVSSVRLLEAEGGWYSILKLPDHRTEEEWTMDFLQLDKVFVHPGFFFDLTEEPFIVLSLLTPGAVFVEGVERILKRLK